MSSAKKLRELNRAKVDYEQKRLLAESAIARHAMLDIAESVAAKQIERLTTECDAMKRRVDELENERDKAHQYWQIAEGRCDALKQQRDDLLSAAEAIEIDAEECLDFDECTAILVPIDTYHKLIEAIASVKEK